MSLQFLIDSVNAGAINAPPATALAPMPAQSRDFGDAVQASFERDFPRVAAIGQGATQVPVQDARSFEPGANPDWGDRVALAFDRLFPPKGATS